MTNKKFYELIGKDNYFYNMFQEVTYCEKMDVMHKLVYAWQQQVNDFLKYTPKEVLDYFISQFETYDGRNLYRMLTLKNGEKVHKENRKLIASTTDINSFEVVKESWKKSGVSFENKYFKVYGEKMLNVQKYRDFRESEYIIYNPILFEIKKEELKKIANKYEEIKKEKANEIIENRLPLGKFWCKESNRYIAIDNETGNAWTEDFDSYEKCERYLNGESYDDIENL